MRQRKSNPILSGLDIDNDNDDDGSNSSQSDPEYSILASHPDDLLSPRAVSGETMWVRRGRTFLGGFGANQTKWAQSLTIAIAALATYSYHTVGATANVQVAIMTVITLVGASPFCQTHLTTAAIGAFVGGQNIIGATKTLEAAPVVGDKILTSYLWLLVLSGGVGSVWTYFVTHPKIKLLDGYAGRLGTTTFIGMNLVMLVLWGPLEVVSWNRYYYGLVGIVHVAEEDSAPPSLASAWSWTEEAELAIGYVFAVLWLGILAGVSRLKHNTYVQEWHRDHMGEDPGKAPTPLNNVLVPVLWALASILVINATGYRHSAGLYNGFAVGAYVGMASLQKVPSVVKFATISLMAALWGLALTPFFVGFAGKSGFTSMIGHVTHDVIEEFVWEKIKYRLQHKHRLRQQQQQQREAQEEEEQRFREEEERLQKQQQEEEKQRLLREEECQKTEPYHPPHKPHRKKELVFSTKQQRRQQQRLKQQQQNQQQYPIQSQTHIDHDINAAPLRHRAWVAPAEGDGIWDHPQLHDVSASSKADVV